MFTRTALWGLATLFAAAVWTFTATSVTATAGSSSVIFVDSMASGVNDGSSWADAFIDLQDALTAAQNSGGTITQIWVAAGTYKPAPPESNRAISFDLFDGVAIYGGFSGGETELSQRDPVAHRTILSGDLNGDDDTPDSGSNCCNDRQDAGCDDAECEAAICAEDSFCCDDRWDSTCVARSICLCGDICSSQCDNSFHVVQSTNNVDSAVLDGFLIAAGFANDGINIHNRGGGLLVQSSNPTIANCVFLNNQAEISGGAIYSTGGSHFVTNTFFLGNHAGSGGGAYHDGGNPTYVNCAFSGNNANEGGAMVNFGGQATIVNSTFSQNKANSIGGISNTTTAMSTITNCILWENFSNEPQVERRQISSSGNVSLQFSCVEGLTGLLGGLGNIDNHPMFIDALGPDLAAGTLDDNLQVEAESPVIDAGRNAAVPGDLNDLDLDGNRNEPTPIDLGGGARFFDDPRVPNTGEGLPPIVDMGAYEVAGDCNDNGVFDDEDVFNGISPDCNDNNIPDECEINRSSSAPGGPFFCTLDCNPDCDDNGIPDDCQDDGDGDRIPDVCDDCPETAPDVPVDANGCELRGACCFRDFGICFENAIRTECLSVNNGSFLGHGLTCNSDLDEDGVIGCEDECPNDSNKSEPGICGCGVSDQDSDHDGIADCIDPCPSDDPDDTDGDGVCDTNDPCPLDNPDDTDLDGVCDSTDPCPLDNPDDTDSDGVCDSDDGCPGDADKTEPGICGCGEVDDDSDGDGVVNCFDLCPDTLPDTPVDETGCPSEGACCFDTACFDETRPQDCKTLGGTYQGNQTTCSMGCAFFGDLNRDGVVSLFDTTLFVGCLEGPDGAKAGATGCELADFDMNNLVDLVDVAAFQRAFMETP